MVNVYHAKKNNVFQLNPKEKIKKKKKKEK